MDQAGIMRFLGQASDLPFAIRKLGLSATAIRLQNRRACYSFGSCSTIRAA